MLRSAHASTRTALCSHTHKLSQCSDPLTPRHALLSALTRTRTSSRSAPIRSRLDAAKISEAPIRSRLDAATRTQLRSTPHRKRNNSNPAPIHSNPAPIRSRAKLRSAHASTHTPIHSTPIHSDPNSTHTPIHYDPVRSTPIQAPIQSTLTVSFLNTFLTLTSFFSDPFSVSPVLMFFHFWPTTPFLGSTNHHFRSHSDPLSCLGINFFFLLYINFP